MSINAGVEARLRFRGDLWTPELRGFARSAMQGAIGRFEPRVTGVTITLMDLNGPRGGIDKRCRVALGLRCGRMVVVQASADNGFAAISEACSRIRSRLVRTVTRPRGRRRAGSAGAPTIA